LGAYDDRSVALLQMQTPRNMNGAATPAAMQGRTHSLPAVNQRVAELQRI
jgi:hypothetical protein